MKVSTIILLFVAFFSGIGIAKIQHKKEMRQKEKDFEFYISILRNEHECRVQEVNFWMNQNALSYWNGKMGRPIGAPIDHKSKVIYQMETGKAFPTK